MTYGDVNYLLSRQQGGFTPLLVAALSNRATAVRLLLQQRANAAVTLQVRADRSSDSPGQG